MIILCLGISFRSATIELRERLSLTTAEVQAALGHFRAWRAVNLHPEAELVVLSTCNRLELYLAARNVAPDQAAAGLKDFIAGFRAIGVSSIDAHLYRYDQIDAARHLCQVASGLDSMVLGESQILGQVSDAIEMAAQTEAAGVMLSNLFRIAIRVGRRAQTETTIGRNPISVGSVAVNLAEQEIGQAALVNARVLIVGAGMMAELVIKALRARGVQNITVANRTLAHAAALASRWEVTAFGLEELPALIAQADMVIAATGAPHPVIGRETVRPATETPSHQVRVFLDIAMPRDIEPSVGDLPGVRLLNLDNLRSVVDASLAVRQLQVPNVLVIVDDGIAEFEEWVQHSAVQPVITDLRQKAEAIRRHELERAMRHLRDLDPDTRDYIQGLTHSIVNKLLHAPTTRLRAAANDGRAGDYAESLRYLFDLDDHGASGASLTEL